MKTTKILAVVLGLFLMGNVNVALAQDENTERKDSIYGLEASVENGFLNFSFYSTYEMAKMWNIGIDLYYGENGEKVWNMQSNRLWTSDPLEVQFSERFGTVSYETIDGVSKINLSNANLLNISSLKKVEIYIEGEVKMLCLFPWINIL